MTYLCRLAGKTKPALPFKSTQTSDRSMGAGASPCVSLVPRPRLRHVHRTAPPIARSLLAAQALGEELTRGVLKAGSEAGAGGRTILLV